jgi:metacaspase-1
MSGFVKGRALIVGIADYAAVRSLPQIVAKDASDVAALLLDPKVCGYDPKNVVLLTSKQATAQEIRKALSDLTSLGADDTFLFYFSGHGHRATTAAGVEHSYLVAHDGDVGSISSTMIEDTELFELLGEIPSQRQVVIIDACHAGGVGTLKGADTRPVPSGIGKSALDTLSAGRGRVVLASSRADEVSLVLRGAANSLFTDSFLSALKGGAKHKDDGTIGILDVFGYVAKDVPTRQPDQHPVMKADALEDNFSIAKGQVPDAKLTEASTLPRSVRGADMLLARLYPLGPTDNDIWSRAGGDVSRLSFAGNGVAQWHRAIQLVTNGGGGVSLESLLTTAALDFPENADLRGLIINHP